jgi:DNA invertase Pin-like site-specific DNA recombinase
MPAAIPYIRFSSARQTTGSSAERQQQMVTQWLTQHSEYTLSDLTYEDLGRSGYHGDHIREGGGFAKLLQAVEAGSIKAGDVVLVEAIDRTGRLSPMRMLRDVISPIIESGVSIITLDDGVTYNKDSVEGGHLFLLVAKIQAAHGYSKALSERTKASYAIRREQAKATGKVKRHTPIWLTSEGEVIEHIAVHVRQAFELYVSGVGKTAIANRLRASGVAELATCSGPTVEAWLRNQAVIGCWEYGKDNADVQSEIIRGVYPAIVSDELFMLAQQRKKAVATKPRERTSKHFLVGLVKCGVCGANYIIHHKNGKPNNMRCGLHHRLKSAGCTNAETIPFQVVHKIYMITAHSSVGKALQAIQLTESDKRKLALTIERDEVVSGIERLVKLALKIDSPQIEVELEAAEQRRKSIDEELSILNRPVDTVEPRRQMTEVQYNTAVDHDSLFRDDPVKLSALLRQVGYTITVHEGRTLFVSDYKIPFIYAGVVRKGNQTLGYRLFENNHEFVISPIIPDMPTTHKDVEAGAYLVSRSSEVVSMKMANNEVDEEE